jgi:hypothetical protein
MGQSPESYCPPRHQRGCCKFAGSDIAMTRQAQSQRVAQKKKRKKKTTTRAIAMTAAVTCWRECREIRNRENWGVQEGSGVGEFLKSNYFSVPRPVLDRFRRPIGGLSLSPEGRNCQLHYQLNRLPEAIDVYILVRTAVSWRYSSCRWGLHNSRFRAY